MRRHSFSLVLAFTAFSITITQASAQVTILMLALPVSVEPTASTVGEKVIRTGLLTNRLVVTDPGVPDQTVNIEAMLEEEEPWACHSCRGEWSLCYCSAIAISRLHPPCLCFCPSLPTLVSRGCWFSHITVGLHWSGKGRERV